MTEDAKQNPPEGLEARVAALEARAEQNPRPRKNPGKNPRSAAPPAFNAETLDRLHDVYDQTGDPELGRLLDKVCLEDHDDED